MGLFKRWFGTSNRKTAAAQAAAQAEADKARRAAEAAMTPPEDSNQAMAAGDRRLRRLAMNRGLAGTNMASGRGFGTSSLLSQ